MLIVKLHCGIYSLRIKKTIYNYLNDIRSPLYKMLHILCGKAVLGPFLPPHL